MFPLRTMASWGTGATLGALTALSKSAAIVSTPHRERPSCSYAHTTAASLIDKFCSIPVRPLTCRHGALSGHCSMIRGPKAPGGGFSVNVAQQGGTHSGLRIELVPPGTITL